MGSDVSHHDAPDPGVAGAGDARRRRPLLFLGLTMAVSLPFFGLLALDAPMPFGLPPTVVVILAPAVVATSMSAAEGGRAAVGRLWRSLDPRRARTPSAWLAAFLVVPAMGLLEWLLRASSGSGAGTGGPPTSLTMAPAFFLVFMLGAIPEEIGWSGYATGPLAERWGVLAAGCGIGLVWAAWHWAPYLAQGRDLGWIAGQTLLDLALRTLMVWVFVRGGGSTLLVCVVHALGNTVALYPSGFADSDPWAQLWALLVVGAAWIAVVRLIDARRGRTRSA
ncbi:CPBP family intramembrane glutamic endopeptidase [Agromyces sp. M3QZ16-3]|uniref:CPBP family intramembrane glutamic endopeptidase n=1 Tax=Agromyces sp. M3QZ16-3 TaxID=3447585 RepID=UPI003F69202A